MTAKGLCQIIISIFVMITITFAAYFTGYNKGLSEGVEIDKGDKWDCAYSYATGFLMCDRTPKYK